MYETFPLKIVLKSSPALLKAIVTTSITKDGETTTEDIIFEGTEAEVKAKLDALKDVKVKTEGEKKMIKKVIEEVEETTDNN